MYVLYSVLSVDMPPFEPRQSFRDWSIESSQTIELVEPALFHNVWCLVLCIVHGWFSPQDSLFTGCSAACMTALTSYSIVDLG